MERVTWKFKDCKATEKDNNYCVDICDRVGSTFNDDMETLEFAKT